MSWTDGVLEGPGGAATEVREAYRRAAEEGTAAVVDYSPLPDPGAAHDFETDPLWSLIIARAAIERSRLVEAAGLPEPDTDELPPGAVA